MIHFTILLLWVLGFCTVSCQRHPKEKSTDDATLYNVYAAKGRSKWQNTNAEGKKFDNCGLFVYMARRRSQGVFLRADPTSLHWVEVQKVSSDQGGMYVGSIDSRKWDAAKGMALNTTLPKPLGRYGWAWCVRESTSLRRQWRRKGYLQLTTNTKILAVGGAGVGAVAVAAGAIAAPALLRKSPQERAIELQDMRNQVRPQLGRMSPQSE